MVEFYIEVLEHDFKVETDDEIALVIREAKQFKYNKLFTVILEGKEIQVQARQFNEIN